MNVATKEQIFEFPKGTVIFFSNIDRWVATSTFQAILGITQSDGLHTFQASGDIPVYFDNKKGTIPKGTIFWLAKKNGKRL